MNPFAVFLAKCTKNLKLQMKNIHTLQRNHNSLAINFSTQLITFFAVIVALLMGSGCTVITEKDMRKFSEVKQTPELVNYPKLNEIVTAEIGESLIKKEYRILIPSIELKNSAKFKILLQNGEVTLSPGSYNLSQEDSGGALYTTSQSGKDLSGRVRAEIKNSIYIPYADPTKMEGCVAAGIPDQFCGRLENAIIEKSYKEISFDNSFKRELVYVGISKNVISVFYKEFKNDIIRPAFTQEIKYDLDEGKIVGYKGSRFEIIKADNLQIQYRVLKSLD